MTEHNTSGGLTEGEREALDVAVDEAETCLCCGVDYGSKHVYAAVERILADRLAAVTSQQNARLTFRARFMEAENARLRAEREAVEALAYPAWRTNRGHEHETTTEAFAAGRNEVLDDLRAALAGGGRTSGICAGCGGRLGQDCWNEQECVRMLTTTADSPTSHTQQEAEVGARVPALTPLLPTPPTPRRPTRETP